MISLVRALLGTRRAQVFLALGALVALAMQGSPLSNHLGYASALIAGLVGSFVAAVVASVLPSTVRGSSGPLRSAGALLAVAVGYALGWVSLLAGITAGAGLWRAPCAPGVGALWWLLLGVFGPTLGACAGLLAGGVFTRPRAAGRAAAAVVPVFVLWSVARFYRTPGVFAFDPFFGFWPGVLYDESIRLDEAMVTYRLGTAGWIVALAALFVALYDPTRGALGRPRSPPALLAALGGLTLGLAVYLAGPSLGHRMDASEIARTLGGRIDGGRCALRYARTLSPREARLHFEDCEVRVAQVERFFGVRMDGPITVFIFESAEQKQRLMGAANTYIAKPWRGEVYLQHDAFPHPVLMHELAHVIARRFARGPFGVTTRWGAPIPGLIEGAAVAAAWEGESDASAHEWSRAMLDAGLLPPLDRILGLGFYAYGAGTSYTAAGSFSRWLIETRGVARFRDVYRDADFERAYGASLATLESAWRAYLSSLAIPERIAVRARTRFRRASLFARVCPHETADAVDRSELHLLAGDVSRARDALVRAVHDDPTSSFARAMLAEAWVRLGDVPRARALAEQAASELGPAAAARVWLRVADVVWRWRGADEARPLYSRVDPGLFDEDEGRTAEVKRWAIELEGPSEAAEAVRDLLVGRGPLGPDPTVAVARLSSVLEAPSSPPAARAMAGYLTARQLFKNRREQAALARALSADASALPTARLRAELQRIIAESRFHLGDRDGAARAFRVLADDPSRPTGLRDVARDWLDRLGQPAAR